VVREFETCYSGYGQNYRAIQALVRTNIYQKLMDWFIVIEKAKHDIKVVMKTTLGYVEAVERRPKKIAFHDAQELGGPYCSRREAETSFYEVFTGYWATCKKPQGENQVAYHTSTS
jgi:hypothetical protein